MLLEVHGMAAEQKRQLGPPEDMALTTGEAYLSGKKGKSLLELCYDEHQ